MLKQITLPLIILSLAALSPACLPSGDSGGSGDATPRDTSPPPDTSPADVPQFGVGQPGDPCERDTYCERLLVCVNGTCGGFECVEHDDCGEDEDPSNDRGCYKKIGRCTAQDCVVASGLMCEDFDLPGTCDGIVCQE